MLKQQGTIINVTSIGGYISTVTFSASKSAFMTMTESLRMEVKEPNQSMYAPMIMLPCSI